jgi:hypothetical protein
VHLLPPPPLDAMVDDLVGAGDGAADHGVVSGNEERNLGFRVLGVLGFTVRGSPEFVRRS